MTAFIRISLIVLALLGFLSARAADDIQLPALIPQGGTDNMHPIVTQGRLKWSHGAFLTANAQDLQFYTLNTEGDVVSRTRLETPHDAHYSLTDFDRSSDSAIVAAIIPDRDDASAFLAFISPDGKTKKLIKTAPYYPYLLTIARDGTVWTLGYEMINRNVRHPDLDPKDGVLRQFDRGGAQLAAALPQGDLLKRGELLRIGSGNRLCSVGDRLAWYSSMGADARYVEIPTDKIELHVFPGVPNERGNRIAGFAVAEAGDATVTLEGSKGRHTFFFDRLNNRWDRLKVPVNGNGFEPSLVGSDGDGLVFANGTTSAFYKLSN